MTALLVEISPAQPPPTLVMITGELDIASVPALRRHLLALPECSTILDLSGVELLSAAGVTELVDLRGRLTIADARLVLAAAPRPVRRVLAITGLDQTMVVADTVDDAVHLLTAEIPRRPPPRAVPATRSCDADRVSAGSPPGRTAVGRARPRRPV